MSARRKVEDVSHAFLRISHKQVKKILLWRRGRRIIAPVRWGTFRRTRPLSVGWGSDRGTPVDRIFLSRFFEANAKDIRGVVLEAQGPLFSARYGANITKTEIFDIEPRNMAATIIADLNDIGSLPINTFDCVLVPQVTQYLSDPQTGLNNLYSSLRAGGVLLVTIPFIQKVDLHSDQADRVRFSPLGFQDVLEVACVGADIEVKGFGNVLTSVAFLMGISAEEIRPQDFDVYDPAFPMLVVAKVRRPY